METRTTLITIPYAGGGAMALAGITKYLKDDMDILPLELPGRGKRFREAFLTDLNDMVEDLYSTVLAQIQSSSQIVIFGYSMGAILAYFLTLKLQSHFDVRVIIVASMRSLNEIEIENPPMYTLSPEKFLAKFSGMANSGRKFDLYSTESAMKFVEPILRADVKAVETFKYGELIALSIPIVALAGTKDQNVISSYQNWKQFTTTHFESYELEGGHFFLFDQPRQTAQIILETVLETSKNKPNSFIN